MLDYLQLLDLRYGNIGQGKRLLKVFGVQWSVVGTVKRTLPGATYCLVGKHDDVALTFCYLIYRTLPCLQIDVWKSLQTARLPLMSSKAGFMQPPEKLAVTFFNQHSNNLALGRGAWEMMRFPGLTLGG